MQDVQAFESYEFPLFETDNPLSMHPMSEHDFELNNYHKYPETKFFEPSQVQTIKMKNSSDNEWTLSDGYREKLVEMLAQAANGSAAIKSQLDLMFTFQRPGPETAPSAVGWRNKTINMEDEEELRIIQQLHKAMSMNCSADPVAI